MHRKRPRQNLVDQADCCSTRGGNDIPAGVSAPCVSVKQQQLPPCGMQGRKRSSSWKVTIASLLLLLCDNRCSYINQQSSVEAWGSNGGNATVHTTKKGLQLVGSCSKEDFEVQAVFLVCDSPGAYYRGSSTYRDSTTCVYGDKARLQLQCR